MGRVRQRLKPAWSEDQLKALYAERHNCVGWRDHELRVPVTGLLADWMRRECGAKTAADLSCGEGAALDLVQLPLQAKFYGDFAPGHPICGPIEKTIDHIPPDSLLICGETIEHLDDPDGFLTRARERVGSLVVSTPVGSWDDTTPGHYWAWDREEVEAMLEKSLFRVVSYMEMSWPGDPHLIHKFGIWGCR